MLPKSNTTQPLLDTAAQSDTIFGVTLSRIYRLTDISRRVGKIVSYVACSAM